MRCSSKEFKVSCWYGSIADVSTTMPTLYLLASIAIAAADACVAAYGLVVCCLSSPCIILSCRSSCKLDSMQEADTWPSEAHVDHSQTLTFQLLSSRAQRSWTLPIDTCAKASHSQCVSAVCQLLKQGQQTIQCTVAWPLAVINSPVVFVVGSVNDPIYPIKPQKLCPF